MKKIIITYFEPFGGRETNASKEVVSLLNDYQIKELPVSWNKVPHDIDEILSSHPDYLFLVGEAGSYPCLTIEKCAHNTAYGKDNDGVNKDNEPIIDNGPEAITTSFNIDSLPYRLNEDAGKYLCNYTYYLALSKAQATKVLFIHLPYVDNEGNNSVNNLKNDLLNIINILIQ